MAEFESRRTSFPSFVPSARSGSELVTDPESEPADVEPPPPQREGLPPGYRMRADQHYVEQLTARAPLPQLRALPIRDIDAVAPPSLGAIDLLVASITRFGIVQPLLVRSRGARFELIGGFRRLAAAAKAGLTDVPCRVYTCDESRARGAGRGRQRSWRARRSNHFRPLKRLTRRRPRSRNCAGASAPSSPAFIW